MHLIDYINIYKDWEERLSNPPYNLIIKTDGRYKLLKYNYHESDFGLTEVQEARGCIIRQDFDGEWIYVCRPFNKFFNYGEREAASIDWSSATVTEKIDGSLMKLWYDYGEWHLSTSGTIDAFGSIIDDSELSFGKLFVDVLSKNSLYKLPNQTFQQFARFATFSPYATYLFEIVSLKKRIVIPYEKDMIYFLAQIDNESGKQIPINSFQRGQLIKYGVAFPKEIDCNSLAEVVSIVEKFDANHEGFVVRDAFDNRIKVKSPAYFKAAYYFIKGPINKANILMMIRDNMIDDFLGYFNNYEAQVSEVFLDIKKLVDRIYASWNLYYNESITRKEFALRVKDLPYSSLLFKKFTDTTLNIENYVWEDLNLKTLIHLLGYDKED